MNFSPLIKAAAIGVLGVSLAMPATATADSGGRVLYMSNCGICHSAGTDHPGYMRLAQRGVVPPDLEQRSDLTVDFIRVVVRSGLGSMPAFTPTHVSEIELEEIGEYLARKGK